MGLPGTRSASPRSARVVSALPTAPADLSRAWAISPVLQGPGWSARYSATWRRSWPLPSRPLGAAAGAAGVVIGITSVKARRNIGRHWRAHAFRHYPGYNLPGEFPPVFPGTTTTLARLFGRSQRHSASNSGNFRANSAQFVTDSRGHRYRPPPRLFRAAGRLL